VSRPAALVGTVYLLHFDTAFGHAKHYTGWSSDLPARLAEHEAGRGARLTEVVADAGIRWTLTRTWPGVTRAYERALKNQGGAARRCPACGIHPKPAPPSPHWNAVLRGGALVCIEAECRACHQRKPLFAFTPNTRRRLCVQCEETR
jgi:predicted GIY-YIG superfamily endonuclease